MPGQKETGPSKGPAIERLLRDRREQGHDKSPGESVARRLAEILASGHALDAAEKARGVVV